GMTAMAEAGIVDAHIHLYPAEVAADPGAWGRTRGEPGWAAGVAPKGRRSIQGWADPDTLIADMDEAGVGACVMLGWYWERQETCDLQNKWHAGWIREHPGRLLAFAAVQAAAGQAAVAGPGRAPSRARSRPPTAPAQPFFRHRRLTPTLRSDRFPPRRRPRWRRSNPLRIRLSPPPVPARRARARLPP